MTISLSVLFGLVIGLTIKPQGAAAFSFIRWNKGDVLPVLLLKPGIVGFEPSQGFSFDHWSKDEVIPVVIVKPGINGFEPAQGISLTARWAKDEVKAVSITKPALGDSFEPLEYR